MKERIGQKLPGLRLITPSLLVKIKTGLSMKGQLKRASFPNAWISERK
jgi:hypothetical protein